MSTWVHAVFNLLVNSVLSFAFALAVVYTVLACFRIGPTRGKIALLLFPLLKVLGDTGRGIPASSFFWAKMNGATQDLGSFMLGAGFSREGPSLEAKLGAISSAHRYTQSAGDLLDTALSRHVSPRGPELVVATWFVVAVLRLAARASFWSALRCSIRRDLESASLREIRFAGRRRVRVFEGIGTSAPFAAGVFCPYVVLPRSALARLPKAGLEAVIQHELAHVVHGDLALRMLLAVFSDVFWFLPGLRGLLARLQTVSELRADRYAVQNGADAGVLASALISVGEQVVGRRSQRVELVREPHQLAVRVKSLLFASAPPRWGYGHRFGKIAILAVVMLSILRAVVFGNHA